MNFKVNYPFKIALFLNLVSNIILHRNQKPAWWHIEMHAGLSCYSSKNNTQLWLTLTAIRDKATGHHKFPLSDCDFIGVEWHMRSYKKL